MAVILYKYRVVDLVDPDTHEVWGFAVSRDDLVPVQQCDICKMPIGQCRCGK